MRFREQLEKLGACSRALEWVGDKTLEEAWAECWDPEWLAWLICRVCDVGEIEKVVGPIANCSSKFYTEISTAINRAYSILQGSGGFYRARAASQLVNLAINDLRGQKTHQSVRRSLAEEIKTNAPPLKALLKRIEEKCNDIS